MTKTDEKVLCVSRYAVELAVVAGDAAAQLEYLLSQKTYRNRHTPNGNDPDVEHDDRYKQLIPYIVCVNSQGQILAYNRGSKGGEDRLKGRWAIGFGGHVNDEDEDWQSGIYREIYEELGWPMPHFEALKGPIGFLNDDSDDVGRKHLGVVYILRADEVVPREVSEWCWIWPPDECDEVPAGTERWSFLAMPMVRKWMEAN